MESWLNWQSILTGAAFGVITFAVLNSFRTFALKRRADKSLKEIQGKISDVQKQIEQKQKDLEDALKKQLEKLKD